MSDISLGRMSKGAVIECIKIQNMLNEKKIGKARSIERAKAAGVDIVYNYLDEKLLLKGAKDFKSKTLSCELIPETAWFSNLRDVVDKQDWDLVRKDIFSKNKYFCEVCGGRGPKHWVEAHEIWEYDDTNRIQTLKGVLCLCPTCHLCKHLGYANVTKRSDVAMQRLRIVNDWSEQEFHANVDAAWDTWVERSKKNWSLDMSWASRNYKLSKDYKLTYTAKERSESRDRKYPTHI